MNKVNKIILFLIIILLLGVVLISSLGKDESDEYVAPSTPMFNVSAFNEIMPTDIDNFKKNKVYVVFMGSEDCLFTRKMIPVLENAQKEFDFVSQYINIKEVIDLSQNKIVNEDELNYLKELDIKSEDVNITSDLGRTPLTLFIKNKKIIKSYLGYANYETLVGLLSDVGLVKD